MKSIVVIPVIDDQVTLNDIISRLAWHFSDLDVDFHILTEAGLSLRNFSVPSHLDPKISDLFKKIVSKINLIEKKLFEFDDFVAKDTIILNSQEKQTEYNLPNLRKRGFSVYRIDKFLVRQEGSFYIQAAYDHLVDLGDGRNRDQYKFEELFKTKATKQYSAATILATGPSIEESMTHDFSNNFVVACNSTIFDDELMEKAKPDVLVFADPIFHFGASKYAAEFRGKLERFLESNDSVVIIPEKYRHILVASLPMYESRIIAVPYKALSDFNLNLHKNFVLKTTSNILTFLLLPIALTFCNRINIFGCDGRPIDQDDYFWGHGKKVQINSQMQNIKDVHPGFFDIDYNEYYFEHLRTLENLLTQAELKGANIQHNPFSYIPAFVKRKEKSGKENQNIMVLEPDGIGNDGHYVPWHNSLIKSVPKESSISLAVNRKQDPTLYDCKNTDNVFTSHSWGVSRADWCFKSCFNKHESFEKFKIECRDFIECRLDVEKNNVVYIYYGSVQVLRALAEIDEFLLSKYPSISIKYVVCLFHESVILNESITKPQLPEESAVWFQHTFSRSDKYRILAVTEQLRDFIFNAYDCYLSVMANPIPNVSALDSIPARELSVDTDNCKVIFPGRSRPEKGASLLKDALDNIHQVFTSYPKLKFVLTRLDNSANNISHPNLLLCDGQSDEAYLSSLSSADIICLPYLAPYFTYRTSGILVDAMLLKKPVIAIKGTWLGDWVTRTKVGLAVEPRSYLSLVTAAEIIRRNYSFFQKQTDSAFQKYSKTNSWADVVAIL
jgi:glycosyltransferase involved in cell wall biosynthesis